MSRDSLHLLASALCEDSRPMPNGAFAAWFDDRARQHRFVIEPVPFDRLERWRFDPRTGGLSHESGRFFSVDGLRVRQESPRPGEWDQPILHQPEIGILGFLVKRIDGVLHFLAQAKMEPGNINYIQISPTVQATRSNYMRIHQGRSPHYLEYFLDRSRGRVLVDSLQSEQGSRFFRKLNRNIVVETTEEVAVREDFCWLTLGQILRLLRQDNVVNMDARTVLSCIPLDADEASGAGDAEHCVARIERAAGLETGRLARPTSELEAALMDTLTRPVDSPAYAADLRWLAGRRFLAAQTVEPVRPRDMRGWQVTDSVIRHEQGRMFEVIGVRVEASNREVPAWYQPIVRPLSVGLMTYFLRVRQGRAELLVQAKLEPGNADVLEIGPTVQCFPQDENPDDPPAYLAEALDPSFGRCWVDTLQSEEGGRFFRENNHNRIVQVDPDWADPPDENCRWISIHHLKHMVLHSHLLNVEARCLMASLGVGAMRQAN
ncbi:MAG: hypothetical protein BIFFINMI_00853 [Phycisphaerae bacterium]|nr:hypothetical protein [Phycisphaerae bacterium]